mmetsp:Transcript_4179/g.12556  ORF Transcript_4179/g.12556 Transcript_4179/m.12556 type:complete len:337 (+) Transcript_4179:1845-2855(+)
MPLGRKRRGGRRTLGVEVAAGERVHGGHQVVRDSGGRGGRARRGARHGGGAHGTRGVRRHRRLCRRHGRRLGRLAEQPPRGARGERRPPLAEGRGRLRDARLDVSPPRAEGLRARRRLRLEDLQLARCEELVRLGHRRVRVDAQRVRHRVRARAGAARGGGLDQALVRLEHAVRLRHGHVRVDGCRRNQGHGAARRAAHRRGVHGGYVDCVVDGRGGGCCRRRRRRGGGGRGERQLDRPGACSGGRVEHGEGGLRSEGGGFAGRGCRVRDGVGGCGVRMRVLPRLEPVHAARRHVRVLAGDLPDLPDASGDLAIRSTKLDASAVGQRAVGPDCPLR